MGTRAIAGVILLIFDITRQRDRETATTSNNIQRITHSELSGAFLLLLFFYGPRRFRSFIFLILTNYHSSLARLRLQIDKKQILSIVLHIFPTTLAGFVSH